jgi:hypothetical protein
MKRITSFLFVIVFAGVILLPVNANVNKHPSDKLSVADGSGPIPPIPPIPPIGCAFDTTSGALQG